MTVVAADGYDAASVDAIASAAGVSRGTFYLHFGNKLDVARALIDDLKERAGHAVDGTIDSSSSIAEVERVVEAWIDFYQAELDAFRVWHQVAAVEPSLEEPVDPGSSVLVSRVFGSVDHGPETSLVLALMFMQLDRLCHIWLVAGRPFTREVVVAEVARSWVEYYLPRLTRR